MFERYGLTNEALEAGIIDRLLTLVKYGAQLSKKQDRDTIEEQIVCAWRLLQRHGVEIEQF